MTRTRRSMPLVAVTGLIAGMILTVSPPAFAAGPTLEVCDTCTHTTISSAIAAASNGDTIRVAAGTYAEEVLVNKSVTLIGPNSGRSPNSGDPLVANTRDPEAIVRPASEENRHGFRIAGGVTSVNISGFTVDLSGSVARQSYFLMNNNRPHLNLTLTDNHFKNAYGSDPGMTTIKGNLGDAEITVQNNRFTGANNGNGLHVMNASGEATTHLTVTDNVWLDNLGWALSTVDNAATLTGTVSNNWIGASHAITGSGDQWATRQRGVIVAGEVEGLQVTHNTFSNVDNAAINFWSGFSGTLAFTDNTIDGYTNGDSSRREAVIYVRNRGPVSDVSGVTLTRNTFDNGTDGSRILSNRNNSGSFNAVKNWWGSERGPEPGQILGPNVNFLPWLAGTSDAGAQVLGVTAHDGGVQLIEGTGAPVVTAESGILQRSGMAWLEYSPLPVSALPGAGSFPFGDVAVSVDITLKTTGDATVDGPFTVCLDGEAPQSLWHYEGGAWVDITNRGLGGITVAPVAGKVCGVVDEFSPFTVAGAPGLAVTGVSSTLLWTGALGGGLLLLVGAGALGVRRKMLHQGG